MKEEWKKIIIDGMTTFYSVSNFGRVRNDSKGTYLKGSVWNNGYRMVHLRYRLDKMCSVHRLVMKAFKPCDDMDFLQVNHIDGDKLNNNISNLEWTTALENMRHSFNSGLQKNKQKMVYIYDLEGKYIGEALGYVGASEITGDDPTNISRCVNEKQIKVNNHQYKSYKKNKIDSWKDNRLKSVYVYKDNGEFVTDFNSRKEASKNLGVVPSIISRAIKGTRKIKGLVLSDFPLD